MDSFKKKRAMEIIKQTDGRWRYGSMVFTSEEEAKVYAVRWVQAKATRAAAKIGQPIDPPAPQTDAVKLDTGIARMILATGVVALCAFVLFSCVSGKPKEDFSSSEALAICQTALKQVSRDPEKAEIPYVPNHGVGGEYYYAWGQQTKMLRMRNGLGLEVAATGSCIVDKSTKRITSLTLNGKDLN